MDADVDVRDPDEKSIMTYVAQFLQYSKDLPVAEEDVQVCSVLNRCFILLRVLQETSAAMSFSEGATVGCCANTLHEESGFHSLLWKCARRQLIGCFRSVLGRLIKTDEQRFIVPTIKPTGSFGPEHAVQTVFILLQVLFAFCFCLSVRC